MNITYLENTMKNRNKLFGLSFTLLTLVFTFFVSHANAVTKPNILVIANDEHIDSVPENNYIVTNAVRNAVQSQLIQEGYEVLDETLLTIDYASVDSNERNTKKGLLELAKSISDRRVDVVVMYTLYAEIEDKGSAKKSFGVFTAHLDLVAIDVNSANVLQPVSDGLESFKNTTPPSAECKKSCVLKHAREYSDKLADQVGYELSQVLQNHFGSNTSGRSNKAYDSANGVTYKLIFDNILSDDMASIENQLKQAPSYISHKAIERRSTKTILEYTSRIDESDLFQSLNQLIGSCSIKGDIRQEGRTFTIKQFSRRGDNQCYFNFTW